MTTAGRVLLVDQNPVNVEVLGQFLARHNYTLDTVDSASEALSILAENHGFDLVLVDLVLPDSDGIALCRQLKSQNLGARLPVVLVSEADTTDETLSEGLDAGADGYLTKPLHDVEVRAWARIATRVSRFYREKGGDMPDEKSMLNEFAKLSHAVNNPLQTLYAEADMLALDCPNNQRVAEAVARIVAAAEAVVDTVERASMMARSRINAGVTSQDN